MEVLILSAITIAITHTILGPDHYLPFIAMAKIGNWSNKKIFFITFVSGLGHILSSVLLGFFGIFAEKKISGLIQIESLKGNLAQWILLLFGIGYLIYSIFNFKKQTHFHFHSHSDGVTHSHNHLENNFNHEHIHENSKIKNLTPWILFTIFVFGPCEPLIPLLIYPAAKFGIFQAIIISIIFGITTIATLIFSVFVGLKSININYFHRFEKYNQIIASIILIFSALLTFIGL